MLVLATLGLALSAALSSPRVRGPDVPGDDRVERHLLALGTRLEQLSPWLATVSTPTSSSPDAKSVTRHDAPAGDNDGPARLGTLILSTSALISRQHCVPFARSRRVVKTGGLQRRRGLWLSDARLVLGGRSSCQSTCLGLSTFSEQCGIRRVAEGAG